MGATTGVNDHYAAVAFISGILRPGLDVKSRTRFVLVLRRCDAEKPVAEDRGALLPRAG